MPDPVNGRDDRWSTDLGVVGALALWSVLFLLAPGYIGFGGPLRGACIVLAVLCGIVAAVGAGIALEKLVQHEAFGYLGVALVFLGPAAGLFVWLRADELGSPWEVLAKVAVLALSAAGGGIAIYGLCLFLEPVGSAQGPKPTVARRAILQSVNAGLIGLLGLGAALVGFVSAFH